jgi:hypothetical protein
MRMDKTNIHSAESEALIQLPDTVTRWPIRQQSVCNRYGTF